MAGTVESPAYRAEWSPRWRSSDHATSTLLVRVLALVRGLGVLHVALGEGAPLVQEHAHVVIHMSFHQTLITVLGRAEVFPVLVGLHPILTSGNQT